MRNFVISALIFVAAMTAVSPAKAELQFCNKTGHPIQLSIAYEIPALHAGLYRISEGWWEIAPGGACVTPQPFRGPLDSNAVYYYYAKHLEVGGGWSGDYDFCVRAKPFTIVNNDEEGCLGENSRFEKFRSVTVDVSGGKTINLTE